MKKRITLLAAMVLTSVASFAQTADEIVDKYLKALGGKDAVAAVTAQRATGTIKVQGMELPFSIVQTAKGQQISKATFQGQELVQGALNGDEGWKTNFMTMKAEKMEAEEIKLLKDEAASFPDPFLNYKDKGYKVELEGEETIDGAATYKVKLIKKPLTIEGKEVDNFVHYFLDKESMLPIMTRSTIKTGPGKGTAVEAYMSDYQAVNGVMQPFTVEQKVNGQTQVAITMEKIEINPTIDESIFAFPK